MGCAGGDDGSSNVDGTPTTPDARRRPGKADGDFTPSTHYTEVARCNSVKNAALDTAESQADMVFRPDLYSMTSASASRSETGVWAQTA
jgi:hypothetical protein